MIASEKSISAPPRGSSQRLLIATPVLLISAELDEVLSLADRIAVMFRGKIAGLVDTADATPEVLGYMMATGKRPEPNGVPRSEFRVPGSEFRA